jgi:mannose-6-phosphate isomerase-like protein (cupin superfamily)
MKLPIVHENDVPELDLPGRHLRWVITAENVNAKCSSACIIRVPPGETVKPAHSHPNGEEVIHIIYGTGRVYIEGKIEAVREGSTVLFPQGAIHMLQNTGKEEMKVICFFAPPSDLTTYKFFDDIEFPA